MSGKIRFVAFLFCLLPLTGLLVGKVMLKATGGPFRAPIRVVPHRSPHSPHAPQPSMNPSVRTALSLTPVVLGLVGSLVLLVDAVTRRYETPKALPVAAAIIGVMSLGMGSVFYYLIWGVKAPPADTADATALCPVCVESTLDRAAPGAGSHNLIGTAYVGSSDRCAECGSTVRTLWFTFLVPVLPLSSYRMLTLGDSSFIRSRFVGRKIRGLLWPQVAAVYIMLALGAGFLALLLV